MPLAAELDALPDALACVTAAAERSTCPAFGELLWRPRPDMAEVEANPAVIFESARRVVALQRVGGELRCYCGGREIGRYDQPDDPVPTERSERGCLWRRTTRWSSRGCT